MVQRSVSAAKRAERYYPVRIRVAVPDQGFGTQLDQMHSWLNAQFGRDSYWVGSETRPGLRDAMLFYFLDVESAQAFINRFSCGVLLVRGTTVD